MLKNTTVLLSILLLFYIILYLYLYKPKIYNNNELKQSESYKKGFYSMSFYIYKKDRENILNCLKKRGEIGAFEILESKILPKENITYIEFSIKNNSSFSVRNMKIKIQKKTNNIFNFDKKSEIRTIDMLKKLKPNEKIKFSFSLKNFDEDDNVELIIVGLEKSNGKVLFHIPDISQDEINRLNSILESNPEMNFYNEDLNSNNDSDVLSIKESEVKSLQPISKK